MAEELLGLDFEIHGGGSDLVFPHHENEAAQTAAARDRPLARLWMHNGMVQYRQGRADPAEKMAKSVGNIFLLGEALDRFGRDALIMYFCSGHYRQPIEFGEERLDAGAGAAWRASGRRRGGWLRARRRRGRSPSRSGSSPRWPRTSAPRARWRRCSTGCARPTAAPAPTGDEDLREMLGVLALENLLEPADDAAGSGRAARRSPPSASRPARRRDFAEADRLRDEVRAAGWEVRDGPDGPELPAGRSDRLRPQPGAGGAPRPPAGRRDLGHGAGGPGAVARGRGRAGPHRRAEEVERRAGSGGHQGICAEVSPFRYARSDEILRGRAPLIVALDEVQDPQNLGAICRTAECAGASAVVICERRAAEVTPAVCKASAGAVEHLPVARVRNLTDFLTEAKAAGAWCYGAAADASDELRARST